MSYLGLIVKATRLCNLRCTYCHDWRAGHGQIMSFQVLAAMTSRALRESPHDTVEFIWHGGEPTILPMAFYEKALYVQARLRRPGQTIRNSLQTNGTRITPAWAGFLKEHRFHVSVSIDGPRDIHDRYRVGVGGQPSFDDALHGIRNLADAGIPSSVLMVIDRAAYDLGPDAIFEFFLHNGIDNYGLVAAKPTNQPDAAAGTPTEHYVTPAQMSSFLIRMYDRWLAHGDPAVHIRELDAIRHRVNGKRSPSCTLAGGCLGRFYLVEPDGEIAHCDLFVGDPAYTLGNVRADRFEDAANSDAMHALQRARQHDLDAMRGCPEFSQCNGWCPHERYLAARHDPLQRNDCCGLRDLITHVRTGEQARTPAAA